MHRQQPTWTGRRSSNWSRLKTLPGHLVQKQTPTEREVHAKDPHRPGWLRSERMGKVPGLTAGLLVSGIAPLWAESVVPRPLLSEEYPRHHSNPPPCHFCLAWLQSACFQLMLSSLLASVVPSSLSVCLAVLGRCLRPDHSRPLHVPWEPELVRISVAVDD